MIEIVSEVNLSFELFFREDQVGQVWVVLEDQVLMVALSQGVPEDTGINMEDSMEPLGRSTA